MDVKSNPIFANAYGKYHKQEHLNYSLNKIIVQCTI